MKNITCVICPKGCQIQAALNNGLWEIKGNGCKRGIEFAINESTNPHRSLTTTVKTAFNEYPLLPVKTDKDIPLNMISTAMKEINKLTLDHEVSIGEILIENLLNTGVNIISTSDIHI